MNKFLAGFIFTICIFGLLYGLVQLVEFVEQAGYLKHLSVLIMFITVWVCSSMAIGIHRENKLRDEYLRRPM